MRTRRPTSWLRLRALLLDPMPVRRALRASAVDVAAVDAVRVVVTPGRLLPLCSLLCRNKRGRARCAAFVFALEG